jgi:hypothetical protein
MSREGYYYAQSELENAMIATSVEKGNLQQYSSAGAVFRRHQKNQRYDTYGEVEFDVPVVRRSL